jgi:hypothetical protein
MGHPQPVIRYFSFTKSKTKMAQIPTVMGNWTTAASRMGPPRGRAKVSSIMARPVSTPTANLLFQVIFGFPLFPALGFLPRASAETLASYVSTIWLESLAGRERFYTYPPSMPRPFLVCG